MPFGENIGAVHLPTDLITPTEDHYLQCGYLFRSCLSARLGGNQEEIAKAEILIKGLIETVGFDQAKLERDLKFVLTKFDPCLVWDKHKPLWWYDNSRV